MSVPLVARQPIHPGETPAAVAADGTVLYRDLNSVAAANGPARPNALAGRAGGDRLGWGQPDRADGVRANPRGNGANGCCRRCKNWCGRAWEALPTRHQVGRFALKALAVLALIVAAATIIYFAGLLAAAVHPIMSIAVSMVMSMMIGRALWTVIPKICDYIDSTFPDPVARRNG